MPPAPEPTRRPRRAPTPDERRQDADRSRQRLLDAALDVFAAKGYAGARVQEIADRAGVNKQLINYYFDSKEGLYRELQRTWLCRERIFAHPDLPLDELAVRYLREALTEPRLTRLMAWRGLLEGEADPPPDDLSPTDLRSRQTRGEIAPDLDPASVRLAIMGAVMAPVVMPQLVRQIFGIDPGSPEFEARYSDHLRKIVRRLARPAQPEPARPTHPTRHNHPSAPDTTAQRGSQRAGSADVVAYREP